MAEQTSKMFDEVIIAVGYNPAKKCMFDEQKRVQLMRNTTSHLNNVSVFILPSNLYLVDYAKLHQVNYLVRGLRSTEDYNYERVLANFNRTRADDITTIFLMPPPEISDLSSSMVKSLIGISGWEDAVEPYVPTNVLNALKEREYNENN